jgi:DNA primase
VKQRFPIEKVVELLGINVVKQKNGQLRGCCPIHSGNDPRGFVVTPDKGLWYCFKACGGGDQIALVAKVRDISPKDAAEWLAVGGTSTRTAEPSSREPVPESGSFAELAYLEASHEAVVATGLDQEIAALIGAGYAPRGTMKGNVLLPVRLRDGTLIGYVGVQEAIPPPRWNLPTEKVVPLRKQKAR